MKKAPLNKKSVMLDSIQHLLFRFQNKFFMTRCGLIFLFFLLSACGFATVEESKTPVFVAPVSGHLGQLLRTDLQNRFKETNDSPDYYRLHITLKQSDLGRQAIQKDATPTRLMFAVTADYRLSFQGKDVLTGTVTHRSSSNIVDNPYSSYVSAKTAEERLIPLIAGDITHRLQIYFKQNP